MGDLRLSLFLMVFRPEEQSLDRLWREYSQVFCDFDDLSLARWMAQTLAQMAGRVWRLSHPLQGAYRLAAQVAYERQIWLKRLVTIPGSYTKAPCCRSPRLPLFTRDIIENGLICQHCSDTVVPFNELPGGLLSALRRWSEEYEPVHEVAHWEESRREAAADYEQQYEEAARSAERLLAQAGSRLVPMLLDLFPAVVWEDQDECLDVQPEDIRLD